MFNVARECREKRMKNVLEFIYKCFILQLNIHRRRMNIFFGTENTTNSKYKAVSKDLFMSSYLCNDLS